jgi:dethiobiotin synthetase
MTKSAPLPGVVILGTDTSAGKTTLSCAILRLAARAGYRPVPHKPVETGWAPGANDSLRLLTASTRGDLTLTDVCPLRFALPVAPELAAAAAGLTLTSASITAAARRLARRGNFLLVETAGGLLSPYGPGATSADIAAELALPILLVSRNGLGTINHTCLAIAELRRRRLPLAALILVHTTPEATPDQPLNAALIAAHTGVTALLTLPFVAASDPDALADALARQPAAADLLARLALSRHNHSRPRPED